MNFVEVIEIWIYHIHVSISLFFRKICVGFELGNIKLARNKCEISTQGLKYAVGISRRLRTQILLQLPPRPKIAQIQLLFWQTSEFL